MIRHYFAIGSDYVKYIPVFVWSSKCCQLIKIHFEQKQQKLVLQENQDKVSTCEKNIEQIKVLQEIGIPITEITDFTAISRRTLQMLDQFNGLLELIDKRIAALNKRFNTFFDEAHLS